MLRFKYRYCKARMTAFLNGQLSPESRRRIARYIDECQDCYDEYQRQRDLMREFEAQLPTFGKPNNDQLSRIWTGIQAEVFAPAEAPRKRRRVHWVYQARCGFAALTVLFTLLVPFMIQDDNFTQAAVTQPTPAQLEDTTHKTDTPDDATQPTAIATQVAAATAAVTADKDAAPEGLLPPQVAPERTPETVTSP